MFPVWRWLFLLGLLLATLWVWGVRLPQNNPPSQSAPAALDKVAISADRDGVKFRGSGWFRVYLYTPAGPLLHEGIDEVVVPYRRTGLLGYRLEAGGHSKEGEIQLKSQPPLSPLYPKVGARAVRVDSPKRPAVVIHPLDEAANVSSQPVEVRVFYPDGSVWSRTLEVRHQLAWSYFPAGKITGVLKVVVQSAEAKAERAEVDVLPGRSVVAKLEAPKAIADADGRDRWSLELLGLRDRLGNPALNGLVVGGVGARAKDGAFDLFVARPSQQAQLPLNLLPPDQAGNYALELFSEDFRSAPQPLAARPGLRVRRLPLRWQGRLLQIGPVEDARSALPDDGTPVRLRLLNHQGQLLMEETVALENGQARWKPPTFSQPTWVDIEVGGQISRLKVPLP